MWFKRTRNFGLGRKRPHLGELTQFARDAGEVIATRVARGATGKLSVAEAYRMVAEKQAAVAKATFAFTKHALRGKIGTATASSFGVFKKAVSSNRRRLRRRSWW